MTDDSNQPLPIPSPARSASAEPGGAMPSLPTRVEVNPVAGEPAAAPRPMELKDMARLVHRSLRGRYILTVTCALICGLAGALACWRLIRPTYHSEALLRIAYTLPAVMQETDQNRPMAQFDTFMLSQRLLITSRRVMDMAVQDPIWKAMNRQVPDKPDRYFAEHLDVDIKPHSEFILVTVKDEDPATAAAAVTAVINAYTELYNSQDKQLERQRTGVLDDRQAFLQGRIDQLANDLREKSKEYGTTKLDDFYDAAAARVVKLEQALADVSVAIATGNSISATATTQPGVKGVLAAATQPAAPQTPDQIATIDPEMRRRLDVLEQRQAFVDRLTALGALPANKQLVAARLDVDQAKADVDKYAEQFRAYSKITGRGINDATQGHALTFGKSLDELVADKERLTKLHTESMHEMVTLGNKRLELDKLQSDITAIREELNGLTKRANVLRAEGSLGGRLSVINSGEIPLSADKDSRIKLAAAGGLAGMTFPIGAFVLLGLLRRRYDFWDEPESEMSATAPLLGIVPEVDEDDDEEKQTAAARSIHQMRVLLRTQANGRRSSVYLVTSSTAKEGKTSLTMSLGLSFAAAGMRTLVIDCDLVGRHLTNAFDASKLTGLREALEKGTVQSFIRRTEGGLHVLTAGGMKSADASALSAMKLGALLKDARKYFHVVLVDSGPILGSLEAAVLGSQVDAAILTVSRGQHRELVRNSLKRLRSLRVHTAGFVYNRAKSDDFESSPYGSSSYYSLTSTPQPADVAGRNDAISGAGSPSAWERFGPLVRAVGAGVPIFSSN